MVSAIILHYHREHVLPVTLGKLAALPVDEIIVVDNGSAGGLHAIVAEFGPRVHLLEPGANLGIAGRNLAARHARGDLLLMLDDDSWPLEGAVEVAEEMFRADPKLGVVGGLVRDVDAEGRVTNEARVGSFDWFLRGGRKGLAPTTGFPAFFFPEGACFVRREAFLDVGGFLEPFRFASVEIELTARLLAAGWDVRYMPTISFDHRREANLVKTRSALYFRIRNQLWYFWLRFPTGLAAWRIAAYGTFDFIECSYRGELQTWWHGVRDAWRRRDTVRGLRTPLPRSVLRRAELNRGRMHFRLLAFQVVNKLRHPRTSLDEIEQATPAPENPEPKAPAVSTPPSAEGRLILLNTWYRAGADFLAKFASIALYIAIARQLGTDDFGVFAFGLSFVTLVTALADFGQDRVLTREVARSHREVDKYYVNTIALKLVLAVPALTVAIAILTAFADAQTRNVAALLGIAVVFEQLMATCFGVFQAYERLVYVPAALVTQRFLTAIVGIAVLLEGGNVVAVSAIYLAGACVGFAIALWLLLSRVVHPRLSLRPRMWRSLMIAALPIGAAGVLSTVLFRADMAMLAAMKSSTDVGNYAAAYRLFETTLFLSWGVGAAVFPVYSRLASSDSASLDRVFERSLKLAVALTLPLAVGAVVLGHGLIDILYGQDYEPAADALVLLAPAIALYPIAYLASYLLVATNRQRVLVPVYGLVAAENILLNFILIPLYSLNGAAVGTSISQALASVPLLIIALRHVGSLNWLRMLGGPVAGSVVAGLVMVALQDDFVIAVIAGAIAYAVVLFFFESRLYPQDARIVRSMLPGRRRAASLSG